MKIVVFEGGACESAIRLLQVCVENLRTQKVKAKAFGTSDGDAGIEIVDLGPRTQDWVVGYVDGYSDRWGDE